MTANPIESSDSEVMKIQRLDQKWINPEIMFGVEQMMDHAARKLGMDPIELRLKNIRKVGEPGNLGYTIQSTAQAQCIKRGAERMGFHEKGGAKKRGRFQRGIGMATASYGSNIFPTLLEHSSAFIKFNEDGTATLIAHPGSGGSGCVGVLCQIAAETLGVRVEDISLIRGGKQDAFYPTISRAKQRIIESSLAGCLGNRYNPRIVQLQVQSIDRSYVPTQQIEITAEPFEAKSQRLRQERMAEVGQGLDNYAIASPSAPVTSENGYKSDAPREGF